MPAALNQTRSGHDPASMKPASTPAAEIRCCCKPPCFASR